MTREPLDSRIEMMIASLYGELSPEDERHFQQLLSSDPELQKEWDEATATRSFLGAWEFDEPTPTFERPAEAKSAPWDALPQEGGGDGRTGAHLTGARNQAPARGHDGGWRDRFRAVFSPARGLGWAVAATAIALLVFSWMGLKVDRVDGGLALRMNSSEGGSRLQGAGLSATSSEQESPEWGTTQIPLTGRFASIEEGTSPYLSRAEFDAYTAGMARVMSELVHSKNENSARSREFNGFMRTLVEGLTVRRDEDYQELRGLIEANRYGLNEVEMSANDRFDLMEVKGQSLTPQTDREGGK